MTSYDALRAMHKTRQAERHSYYMLAVAFSRDFVNRFRQCIGAPANFAWAPPRRMPDTSYVALCRVEDMLDGALNFVDTENNFDHLIEKADEGFVFGLKIESAPDV
jgi:hypothetical protein